MRLIYREVEICDRKGSKKVNALFDTGSSESFIKKDIAEEISSFGGVLLSNAKCHSVPESSSGQSLDTESKSGLNVLSFRVPCHCEPKAKQSRNIAISSLSQVSGFLFLLPTAYFLLAISCLYAEDAEIKLNSTDGSTCFVVQDKTGLVVSSITSAGNAYFKGNVGIGTTGPARKLSVAGGGQVGILSGTNPLGDAVGRFEVAGGSGELIMWRRDLATYPGTLVAGDKFSWYSPNSGSMRAYTDVTGDLLTITSAGNVGIGTTSPSERLHVAGNVLVSTATTSPILFVSTTTGNVGIGTTGPGAKLHVSGGGMILDFPSDNSVRLQNTGAGGRTWDLSNINIGTPRFRIWDNTALAERVSIDGSGNVGIGTTAPGAKFEVVGGSVTVNCPAGFTGDVLGLSTGTVNLFRFQANGVAKSKVSFDAGGADYAEWFKKEENINIGDVVGLNMSTGKVRKYVSGDMLVGICSGNAGFVGNRPIDKSDSEMSRDYVLVGLVGQLAFNNEQVNIIGRKIETKDSKQLGGLLDDGKLFLRIKE